jgi:hypothetical protein
MTKCKAIHFSFVIGWGVLCFVTLFTRDKQSAFVIESQCHWLLNCRSLDMSASLIPSKLGPLGLWVRGQRWTLTHGEGCDLFICVRNEGNAIENVFIKLQQCVSSVFVGKLCVFQCWYRDVYWTNGRPFYFGLISIWLFESKVCSNFMDRF